MYFLVGQSTDCSADGTDCMYVAYLWAEQYNSVWIVPNLVDPYSYYEL